MWRLYDVHAANVFAGDPESVGGRLMCASMLPVLFIAKRGQPDT